MMGNTYIYILVMALTSYLLRVLPMTIFRKPITNSFVKSFLYYAPYVTISVMTFPSILNATGNQLYGLIAFIVGVIFAYKGASLFTVAVVCCSSVLLLEFIPFI